MNKDHFGYYLVGSLKTYSKIEALEYAHLVRTPVKWIFNDDVFSKHPWHIDTQENLKKLYKQRAEQIRKKYDYIVIWYSGGVDSFTVLNTFRENNLHVDEIAQFHAHEGEKTWDSYLNIEVKTVAIPQTQEFLNVMPNTKHRLVDLTPIIKSVFNEDHNKFDFIYKSNHSFGPHQLARTYVREKISDWAKIIASGKKLCFVWGADKPPVMYDETENKYYIEFFDIIDGNGVGPRIQMMNRKEDNDEFFYWSTDSIDILARQGHIVKNYLRNPPKEDLDSRYLTSDPYNWVLAYNGEYVPYSYRRPATKINNKMYYLTPDGLNRLIYPDWKEGTFTVGKNIGYIFGPRDRWWWEAHRADDQTRFIGAIKSIYKKFDLWGFHNFKWHRNNFAKNVPALPEHIRSKVPSSVDFRNLSIDVFCSERHYLEI